MRTVVAVVMLIHGFAHLVGFVVPWHLIKSAAPQDKTTILGGRIDVGVVGIKILGVLWLLTGVAFAIVATGALLRATWWPSVTLLAVAISLVMCVLGWPEAKLGIPINLLVLVGLLAVTSAENIYPRVEHPPLPAPEPEPTYLTTPDQLRLYYRIDSANDKPEALVWFVQTSEVTSVNTYPRFTSALLERGITVAWFHPRGAGYSDGLRGDIDDYGTILADYQLFAAELRKRYPGLPLVLFGHSAGGALALEIAARAVTPFSALILLNPAFKYRSDIGPSPGDIARFGFNYLFRRSALTVDMLGDPSRIRDPLDRAEGEALNNDALVVRYYSLRYLMGLRSVMQRCPENARRVTAPLLFVQGAADEVIDAAGGDEIVNTYAGADKTKLMVEDRGHGSAVIEARATEVADWIIARTRQR